MDDVIQILTLFVFQLESRVVSISDGLGPEVGGPIERKRGVDPPGTWDRRRSYYK